jgi:hypothetical protein
LRAACIKEGRLISDDVSRAPPPILAAETGHRNSPTHSALKNGYRELQFGHFKKAQGGDALENIAQRLRRKHRDWSRVGRVEKEWLQWMAIGWAATLYPHAARRTYQEDPVAVCRRMARAAREEAFCERWLIPILNEQEASANNRVFCQRVKPPFF